MLFKLKLIIYNIQELVRLITIIAFIIFNKCSIIEKIIISILNFKFWENRKYILKYFDKYDNCEKIFKILLQINNSLLKNV